MTKYFRLFVASFLCLTVIIGCNDKTDEERFNESFYNKKTLTPGENIELNNNYVRSLNMIINDSLALFEQDQSDYFFSIYNLNNQKVEHQLCRRGKGPEEMIGIGSVWIDYTTDSFYVYDVPLQKLFSYPIECLLSHNYFPPQIRTINFPSNIKNVYTMTPVNNNEVLCTGIFNEGALAHFNYHDAVTKGAYGEYFVGEEFKHIPNWVLGSANQGAVYKNPTGNKFINATYRCGHLEFFSIDNYEYKVSNSYTIHPAIFEEISFPNGHRTAALKKVNRLGFIDVTYTPDLCFVLYSGRSMSDYGNKCAYGRDIYVFTWDGEPIIHYQLEQDANSIAISHDGKYLYALTIDEDISLQKFTL